MGQHFVFVVPDSVLEPTVVPPAHLIKGSNASCAAEKLTSDLAVYVVPLDGCVTTQVGLTCVQVLSS